MTQTHPLTPPDELLDQWCITGKSGNLHNALTLAYRAGADQELEACCHEVQNMYSGGSRLRAARRPKPPRLKEQALAELEKVDMLLDTIRRAIEQLPN